MHNVDYINVGGGEQWTPWRAEKEQERERGDVYTTRVQMALTLAV